MRQMMTMKTIFLACFTPLLLVGCATTQTASSGSDSLVFTGFSQQTDGGQYHGGTGLLCPPTLLNLPISDQREYGTDATDASCTYQAKDQFATIYLSKLNETFQSNFQGSVASIVQGPLGEKAEFDEEVTQTCQLGGLLTAAVTPSEEADRAKSSEPYAFETAVFSSSDLVTILQLTELDKKFLKLRYTRLNTPSSERLNSCIEGYAALRSVYNLTRERGLR
jgi:hypothetical protein